MEEVPKIGRFKVAEPERREFEDFTEYKNKKIRFSKELLEAAEQTGINVEAVVNEALAEEVASLSEYIGQLLGHNYSEQESEYILELVKKELYKKSTQPEVEGRIDNRRRQIYKDIFGVDIVSEEEYEHLESMRQQAWDAAEALQIEEPV